VPSAQKDRKERKRIIKGDEKWLGVKALPRGTVGRRASAGPQPKESKGRLRKLRRPTIQGISKLTREDRRVFHG